MVCWRFWLLFVSFCGFATFLRFFGAGDLGVFTRGLGVFTRGLGVFTRGPHSCLSSGLPAPAVMHVCCFGAPHTCWFVLSFRLFCSSWVLCWLHAGSGEPFLEHKHLVPGCGPCSPAEHVSGERPRVSRADQGVRAAHGHLAVCLLACVLSIF